MGTIYFSGILNCITSSLSVLKIISIFKWHLIFSVSTLGWTRVSSMLRIIMNLIAESPQEGELEAFVQASKYAAAGSILDRPQFLAQAFHGDISVVSFSLLSRANRVGLVCMNHKYTVF